MAVPSRPFLDPSVDSLSVEGFFLLDREDGLWSYGAGGADYTYFSSTGKPMLGAVLTLKKLGGDLVKIYSCTDMKFLSAIGDGWPLRARVDDEQWSIFRLIVNPNKTISFQSTAEPAVKAGCTFVSAIGNERRLRIAEAAPTEWSCFTPVHLDAP